MPETLHLYVPDHSYQETASGQHILFRHFAAALPGWQVRLHRDGRLARLMAPWRGGHGLFYKHEPNHRNILCLRRAYLYPFWRIERTNRRWEFDIARVGFDPTRAVPPAARGFVNYWRGQLLNTRDFTAGGYIYIPLQGHLRRRRSFQSFSPIEMIEATLAHDPRPVLANLHPKETYDARDIAALENLSRRFSRFSLVNKPSSELIRHCDYIVTQNSAAALTGYFAGKRAILFAMIDFHHIAGSVPRDGLEAAFSSLQAPAPDFTAYLHWFFHTRCINARAADAPEQIADRMRAHDWPV